ncbi:MAG: hypothetical protein IH612_21645 [Desulfofustis sp.]|nr:hypothetical protein [Desulfofustis sp.]
MPAALKLPNRRQAAAEAVNRVPGAPRPKHPLQQVKFNKPHPRKVKSNQPRPRREAAEAAVKAAPGALTNNLPKINRRRKSKKAAEAVD